MITQINAYGFPLDAPVIGEFPAFTTQADNDHKSTSEAAGRAPDQSAQASLSNQIAPNITQRHTSTAANSQPTDYYQQEMTMKFFSLFRRPSESVYRFVTPSLDVTYKNRRYSVADVPGVMVGGKVEILLGRHTLRFRAVEQ